MELKKFLEGKSRLKLALKVGVSLSAMNKYCAGSLKPSVKVAKKIEKATKGQVTWISLVDRDI